MKPRIMYFNKDFGEYITATDHCWSYEDNMDRYSVVIKKDKIISSQA